MGLTQEWPALREMAEALQAGSLQGGNPPHGNPIPQPGPKLAQTILFFIAALRQGDVAAWLGGRASSELRSMGRMDLMGRLGEDFQQIARIANDGAQGDWKSYLVPLYDGERLQQIRFFHRKYGDGGAEDFSEHSDRFLIDLELSRLGAIQFDGLLQANRFSLILRSANSFDDAAKAKIESIFREGCECSDVAGEITFADARTFVSLPFDESELSPGTLTA